MKSRSVNVYLRVFSLCKGCGWLGEVDEEPKCTNPDGSFDFRSGEYCRGFSPKAGKKRVFA